MRCLVTGASGHIGSFLVSHLVESGHETTIVVRENSNLWRLEGILDRVGIIRGTLDDISSCACQIRGLQADTVFHLAWSGVTRHTRNNPDRLLANVRGSLDLFGLVKDAGCRCWVGVGSQAEYGPSMNVLSEVQHAQPECGYGTAKKALGELLMKLCALSGIRGIWLRLLATYGPKDNELHLIPYLIETLLQRQRPALSDGVQRCDYLYVEDAARALACAALERNAQGIYNLASGKAVQVREIAERVRDVIDPALDLGFGEIPGSTSNLEANIDRLRKDANWEPAVSLEQGLYETIAWHRARMRSGS